MIGLAIVGALAFLAAVYVAYRLSTGSIGPAGTAYDEVTETDDGFLRGDFPEQPDRAYQAVTQQRARRAANPSQMPMRRQP